VEQNSITMIKCCDYSIRTLQEKDLRSLEWGGEFTHFRRLYQEIFYSYIEGNSILWVVNRDCYELIGQIFVQFKSRRPELADGIQRAYFYGFRIKPAFRGNGIGTALLNHAETDLVGRNFCQATLNVARENMYTQLFYKHRGYKIVAPESGHWSYFDHLGNRREINEPSWRMVKMIKS